MRSLWWIGEQVGANISWLVASHLYPQVINSSCLFARPLIVDQFIFRTVFTETRSAQTYQVQSCNSPKNEETKWKNFHIFSREKATSITIVSFRVEKSFHKKETGLV